MDPEIHHPFSGNRDSRWLKIGGKGGLGVRDLANKCSKKHREELRGCHPVLSSGVVIMEASEGWG